MEVEILGKSGVFRGERSDELGDVYIICMSHWVSYLKDWACNEGRENLTKHKCTLT